MKETKMTIQTMLNVPIGNLAKSTVDVLYGLHEEAKVNLEKARAAKEWIESAMALKYQEQFRAKRLRLEKDSGIIHLEDDGFKVSNDVPKKVEWDQRGLEKIAGDIAISGGNVADYIEVHYHVPERLYNNCPALLQQKFNEARRLKMGKPIYKLTKLGTDGGSL